MSLESLLATLKRDVTAVTAVRPAPMLGFRCNGTKTADVAAVPGPGDGGSAVTAVTARQNLPLQAKPAPMLACTSDTSDTAPSVDSHGDALQGGAEMPPKLWDVCIAPGTPPQTVAKFRAASKALDALILAEGLPTPDPNRWCWPHSEAMNDAEAAIAETGCLPADLIEAAMRVCDRHGDGEAAREEMRADCLALAPHLRADLLAHFRGTRQAAKGKP